MIQSKTEIIPLGNILLKSKLSDNLVNSLNILIDEKLKKNNMEKVNDRLAGKIENEYGIFDILKECDKEEEIPNLVHEFHNYCSAVGLTEEKNYKIKYHTAWFNDQKQYEYNPIHTHSGVSEKGYSTVFFLRVPDFGKEITRSDVPHNGTLQFLTDRISYLAHPFVGDIYVFNYELKHCVYPFFGENIRRSVSANFDLFLEK